MADFHGLGERAEYRTERAGADGADSRADGVDSIILGGIQDWTDWGRLGRTGRTTESWTGRTGADGADWGGRGGLGRRGAYGSSLGGRKGQTGKPRAGVLAGWADRLGCARPGRLASLRLRAEGIPAVLSPDANCGVIWLHTSGIHIGFFGAHVVVIFLGTLTTKAQRASTGDKFFGSVGALNITYSMFIQMGHAIRDVVIVTYKGGLLSLVPPSPLCISCCS